MITFYSPYDLISLWDAHYAAQNYERFRTERIQGKYKLTYRAKR